MSAEARDREECYRDLRAYDQARGRPSIGGRPDGPRLGDGGWKWKGLELGPEANRVADEGLAVRRAAEGRDAEGSYGEGGLTPAMRRVEAELTHGTLVPDTEKLRPQIPRPLQGKASQDDRTLILVTLRVSSSRRSTTASAIRSCFQDRGLHGWGGRRRTQALAVTADTTSRIRKPLVERGGLPGRQQPMVRLPTAGSPVRGPVSHAGELGRQAADTRYHTRSCAIQGLRQGNVNSYEERSKADRCGNSHLCRQELRLLPTT